MGGDGRNFCPRSGRDCDECSSSSYNELNLSLQLHCLPVEQIITYKLCLFMHHINIEVAPKYLYFVATSFNYNSNNNNIGCNDVTKFDYTR